MNKLNTNLNPKPYSGPKTPRISRYKCTKMKVKFSLNPTEAQSKKASEKIVVKEPIQKEKEITLVDIANYLSETIRKLDPISDIRKEVINLKEILVDLYKIINDNEKSSKKSDIKSENSFEKNSDNIGHVNTSGNHDNSLNRSKLGILEINKEKIKKGFEAEQRNFTNSCNNLIFIQKKKNDKEFPFENQELTYKIETYKNGNRYEGYIKNGLREGKGTMFYNNGSKYEGDWKNGIRDGKGKYFMNGGEYVGDFKNGCVEGKGISYYKNGDKYVGYYKNWNKNGKGIYYHHNGDKYDGYFVNDKAEGKGIYYYKNGNRIEGYFQNGATEAKGIFYYNCGECKDDRYEGEIKNWIKEGKGIYYFKNGDIYVGEFKKDKKEGKGIIYYKNGDREMGDYLNGKKIGKHVKLTIGGKVIPKNY